MCKILGKIITVGQRVYFLWTVLPAVAGAIMTTGFSGFFLNLTWPWAVFYGFWGFIAVLLSACFTAYFYLRWLDSKNRPNREVIQYWDEDVINQMGIGHDLLKLIGKRYPQIVIINGKKEEIPHPNENHWSNKRKR
ncbi:MAG: hypothetical protein OXI87_04195 [Albidovulum sp.]|nr:hypothetical protein [Albidovulum sp.]